MAELLLRNARVWTGDAASPWAEAALVQNGRFAFAGRERYLNAPAGARAKRAEASVVS